MRRDEAEVVYDKNYYIIAGERRGKTMALQLGALREAGAPEDKANKAAEELAGHSGGDSHHNSGMYCPKGYARVCKTYRLTEKGRPVAMQVTAEIRAELKAIEDANPKLREVAEKIRAAVSKL
jgi:hypothetical protein